MLEIEETVLDYIHDYIVLDRSDRHHLENEFAQIQLGRLYDMADLGVVGKLRRLARHNKLEHAYGTYWLCHECVRIRPGLIDDKKAFRIAALMHGIGHLPFSYDAEQAVAKLCQIHSPTQTWFEALVERCIDFAGNPGLKQAASDIKSTMHFATLHRWIGSWKIAQSKPGEFNNELGKAIVRILLDPQLLEHQLLAELDRLDFIMRDMLYLGLGRMDLNLSPLLEQFGKAPGGGLERPGFTKVIEKTHDWLCDEVYLCSEERCLAQVMEKSLIWSVVEQHFAIEDLLDMPDRCLEELVGNLPSNPIDIQQTVRRIKKRRLIQVARVACERGDNTVIELEKELAGTNKTCLHKYAQTKGIHIDCIPNPYITDVEAYEFTSNGVSVGIICDLDSNCPHHVIGALILAERWAPENWYGTELTCQEQALEFLLGKKSKPTFDRYYNYVSQIIMKHMPKSSDVWNKDLFHEKWALGEYAIFEALFYEYEETWPARHFLRFPEHWNSQLIKDVLSSVEHSRTRKRRGEAKDKYDERAQVLLEYTTYLEAVLRHREEGLSGWVVPSVQIWDENGQKYAEVDVIKVYVPRPHSGPVKMELHAVSVNTGVDNQDDNRRKLNKVAQLVKGRFGRKVLVTGYFNGLQVS